MTTKSDTSPSERGYTISKELLKRINGWLANVDLVGTGSAPLERVYKQLMDDQEAVEKLLTAAPTQSDVERALVEALTNAVAIIRKYVPNDALGVNTEGGGDGWNDRSWAILDEHLHYMDEALALAQARAVAK